MTTTIETSSPAEMQAPSVGTDTIPVPKAPSKSSKRSSANGGTKRSSKRSKRPTGKPAGSSPKRSGSKPTKVRGRKLYQGVATTTRSGKKITRAKAGQKGVLAKKGVHLLVVRVDPKLHAKVWAKVKAAKKKDKGASANALIVSLLSRGLR